jgi:L-cysteine desulfidase
MRTIIKQLWTCPKCKRQFERKGQLHSCRPFAIEQHFAGRNDEKELYEQLKRAVKKSVGNFKIESLECCIHFVSSITFAAVKIMKGKIRIDFALHHRIKNKRIVRELKMSARRWLYVIDIYTENEIDEQLLNWIKEAHDKKAEKLELA